MIRIKRTKKGVLVKCPNPNCEKWIRVEIAKDSFSVGSNFDGDNFIFEVKTGLSFDCDGCGNKWGLHKI